MKKINGIDVHKGNSCASHMPIQLELLNVFKPKKILELGCGFFSTKMYLENKDCTKLVSIESDSDEWFKKTEEQYSIHKNKKWEHLKISGLENVTNFIKTADNFDLIFVDGSEYRAEETNASFEKSEIIIGHDTQWFFRDKYNIPKEYKKIDFKNFPISYGHNAGYSDNPWTTLFTSNLDVYEYFFALEEKKLYEKYSFPYVYDVVPY